MVTLDVGNVLLKPAHRRRLMSMLKRIVRLGERLGTFNLKIALRRVGRHVEMTAHGKDRVGTFACRTRKQTLLDAMHALIDDLRGAIHAQRMGVAA